MWSDLSKLALFFHCLIVLERGTVAPPPLPRVKKTSFHGKNSLETLASYGSSRSVSTSSSSLTYECLYISPKLPLCDYERMKDSGEDVGRRSIEDYWKTNGSHENFGKDHSSRARRNVDESARRQVIVYTIEGCLPTRLPLAVRPCKEDNPHYDIVEVRRFYPFVVKNLTRPPRIFPQFNYDRWERMIERLRVGGSTSKDTNLSPRTTSSASKSTTRIIHEKKEERRGKKRYFFPYARNTRDIFMV